MPEAEHGFLYQMIGEGYKIDNGKGYVTGPLHRPERQRHRASTVPDPLRRLGPDSSRPSPQLMYQNEDSLLGYVYTDEGDPVSRPRKPTVAIESGYEKNPQMIMWDPATYPDVTERSKTSARHDAKVRSLRTAPPTWRTSSTPGILKESPGRRLVLRRLERCSSPTRARRPSRASARPSRTTTQEVLEGWKKPVRPTSTSTTPAGTTTPSRSRRSRRTSRQYAACFAEARADHPARLGGLPGRSSPHERDHPRRGERVRRELRLELHRGQRRASA